MKNNHQKLLFWQLSNRGFGSEVNNLLYAINYAQKNNLKLYVSSSTWNFAQKKGWLDYFISLKNEGENKIIRRTIALTAFLDRYFGMSKLRYYEDKFNTHNNSERPFRIKNIIYLIIRTIINQIKPKKAVLIHECFSDVRKFNKLDFQANKKTFVKDMNKILQSIWKINESTRDKVNKKKLKIKNKYAVFHIRRGDKILSNEDCLYKEELYVQRLLKLEPLIKTVFVMSDDYNTFQALRNKFPHIDFLTLINNNEQGHNQNKFNSKTPLQREQSLITLLAEIEIAVDSNVFIGSKKSNIFRLVEYFKTIDCYDISSSECDYVI